MLTRLFFLIIILNAFFCIQKEEKSLQLSIENANKISNCYELSADHNEIQKLSNYLNVNFDNIEKNGGVYVYFELTKDELNFGYQSNIETIKDKLEKIDDNIFYIPTKKIFIGRKNFRNSNEEVIWLSDSRKTLFLEENAFGNKVLDRKTCIDRHKLKMIYDDRKREVEFGPEPTGDYDK